MKIQFYKTEIIYQGKFYKILSPVIPLTDTYIGVVTDNTPFVFANKADFISLATLFTLLTEMKGVIIYLPTRNNQTDYLKQIWFGVGNSLDMVICHHSLQFKQRLFKVLKNRLSKRNLVSFKLDIMKFADIAFDKKFWYRENKDLLDITKGQDTLFLAGSAKVFAQLARECLRFRGIAEEPPYHIHTHLDTYLRHGGTQCYEGDMQLCFYDELLWQKWFDEQGKVGASVNGI